MDVNLSMIEEAAERVKGVVFHTPLQYSKRLSKKYDADVYIKREDLQEVRSFKIRGAYNKIASLSDEEKKRGVVCASAGNHAQGVAYSCAALKINGVIFMPVISPNQKIEKVKHFGGKYVEVKLFGNTFDEASAASKEYCITHNAVYVHPFDDPYTIAGQGTVAKEMYEDRNGKVDYVMVPIGGGGLISGVSTYFKNKNKDTKIVGVEPTGAAEMEASVKAGKLVTLEKIDTFVDGCAVKTAGNLTFSIVQKNVDKLVTVPEGKVCSIMIELYQNEGIIAEPSGALAVAALDEVADVIKGKTVICLLSGGNNDILRYPEIMERSLVYQERKHYFIVNFAQKPGQLKNLLNFVLGPNDDIVLFEYMKKTNREQGPALIGIELKDKKDLAPLLKRMEEQQINYRKVNGDDMLYGLLV